MKIQCWALRCFVLAVALMGSDVSTCLAQQRRTGLIFTEAKKYEKAPLRLALERMGSGHGKHSI